MKNIIIICKKDNIVIKKKNIIKKWIKDNYPDKKIYSETNYKLEINLDLIICIGGDGTLLYANKFLSQNKTIPFFLVGSGTLEFIPNNNYDNFKNNLRKIFNNNFNTLELTKINIDSFNYQAINEISIHRSNSSKILTLEIYIDNFLITNFRGDGLIVSTPIGSTAYNLSAGGSLIAPNNSVFIITPICPFSLSFRPLIISDDSIINIKIIKSDTSVQIEGDGNFISNLNKGDNIIIKKDNNKINLLYSDKININNWFLNLTKKLNWGN